MENIDPIVWKDKVNSPELLAYLQQFGEENYLTAEQINELKNKINLIIGKEYELKSNKSNFVTDADSSEKFPVWSAITLWIKEKLIAAIPSKNSAEETDVIIIGDNSNSGKTKKIFLSNFLVWIKDFLQVKDKQIEIGNSGNVQNSWHGQTILFTASCTQTVPSTLNPSLMFPFRTLTGVTVTWLITPPLAWEVTPVATTEKTTGHFMRRGNTNMIMLDV